VPLLLRRQSSGGGLRDGGLDVDLLGVRSSHVFVLVGAGALLALFACREKEKDDGVRE
jgi:hypothetical protein